MINVGVAQSENGEFNWTCGCGATGTPTKDRDNARDAFKEHRRSACTSQDSVQTTPQQKPTEVKTMDMFKQKATTQKASAKKAKKGRSDNKERAVNEKQALQVIEKLRAGKSTIMAEARHLGCYHATLRKALRAAIGEKAFDQLMAGKKGKKVTPAKKASKHSNKAAPKKAASKKKPTPVKAAKQPTRAARKRVEVAVEANVDVAEPDNAPLTEITGVVNA